MRVKQVFIMAGGSGQRLHPVTLYTPKFALQILDEPLLVKQLHLIHQLKPDKVHLMINKNDLYWAQAIADKIKGRFSFDLEIIVEKDKLGLVHAFNAIESHLVEDYFMVLFGDEYFYESSFFRDLECLEDQSVFGAVSSDKLSISQGCNIVCDQDSELKRLIEKPKYEAIVGDLSWSGVAVFNRALFDYSRVVDAQDRAHNMTLIEWFNQYIEGEKTVVIRDKGFNININLYDDYRKCLAMEMRKDNEKYSNHHLSFNWDWRDVHNSKPVKTV